MAVVYEIYKILSLNTKASTSTSHEQHEQTIPADPNPNISWLEGVIAYPKEWINAQSTSFLGALVHL